MPVEYLLATYLVDYLGVKFPEKFDFPLQLLGKRRLNPCSLDGGQLAFHHLEFLLKGLFLFLKM